MAKPLAAASVTETSIQDFSSWMQQEQLRIYRLCRQMLQDSDEADAATQDAFCKAWRALDKAADHELTDPRRWITRIAINTCLDRLRSRRWQFWRRRPDSKTEGLILNGTAAETPSAEDRVFATQLSARLNEGLGKLSGRQRSIFLLRHQEGLTLDEIGRTLGLEVGTVKAHMARAVRKMRQELGEFYAPRTARMPAGGGVR